MKLKLPSRKRALRGIVFLVVVAIVVLYIGMPIGAGVATVFPTRNRSAR